MSELPGTYNEKVKGGAIQTAFVEPLTTSNADELLNKLEQNIDAIALIESSNKSRHTKRRYLAAIKHYYAWGGRLVDTDQLKEYLAGRTKSQKMGLRAAIALWQKEILSELNRRADFHNLDAIEVIEKRFAGMMDLLKMKKANGGQTAHNWLDAAQVTTLLDIDRATNKGKRDLVLLAMAIFTGARRAELSNIKWAHFGHNPQGHFINIIDGKGDKDRVIPIYNQDFITLLNQWREITGDGYILRGVNKGDNLTEKMSGVAIGNHITRIGKERLSIRLEAHDCRRTFAQEIWLQTHDLLLVSELLGHKAKETTLNYLRIEPENAKNALTHLWNGALSDKLR